MNEIEFQGNWSEVKNRLKEKYAILTDKDLAYEKGEEEKLLNTLQEKLGKDKEEVKDILRSI